VVETDNFRANVKLLCQGYGTVSSLAAHLGIERSSTSRIVNGHATPTILQAEAIAQYFGYSLKQLLLPPEKFSKIALVNRDA
jgi:transcriptional regulator with XRE-family HTH domain